MRLPGGVVPFVDGKSCRRPMSLPNRLPAKVLLQIISHHATLHLLHVHSGTDSFSTVHVPRDIRRSYLSGIPPLQGYVPPVVVATHEAGSLTTFLPPVSLPLFTPTLSLITLHSSLRKGYV